MKNSEIMKKNTTVIVTIVAIIMVLLALASLALYIYFLVIGEKFTIILFILFLIISIIMLVKIISGKRNNENSVLRAGGIDKLYNKLDENSTVKISEKIFISKDDIYVYKMGISTIPLNEIVKVEQDGDGGKYMGIKKGAYKIALILRDGIVEEIGFGSSDKEKEKYAKFMKILKERALLADFGFDKTKECRYN